MSVFPERKEGHVLVIGAAGLDIVGRPVERLDPGTSNPGRLRTSPGGVARNVAENLARLGLETVLLTAIGDDVEGRALLEQTAAAGVNVDACLTVPERATGAYLAVLDERGGLHLGLDDMRIVEAITPEYLEGCEALFKEACVVFVDANLPPTSLRTVVRLARRARAAIAADPTSRSLASRLARHLQHLWLMTPNEAEAEVFCPHELPHGDRERALSAARHLVAQGVEVAIVTMAEFGVGYATPEGSGHIPALQTEIQDPTGAGDALTATVIFALLNDIPVDEAVRLGVSAAALTLRAPGSVHPELSLDLLYDQLL